MEPPHESRPVALADAPHAVGPPPDTRSLHDDTRTWAKAVRARLSGCAAAAHGVCRETSAEDIAGRSAAQLAPRPRPDPGGESGTSSGA